MKHYKLDRRKVDAYAVFPLIDSDGKEVKSDRRSGKDRRRNARNIAVASQILSMLN